MSQLPIDKYVAEHFRQQQKQIEIQQQQQQQQQQQTQQFSHQQKKPKQQKQQQQQRTIQESRSYIIVNHPGCGAEVSCGELNRS